MEKSKPIRSVLVTGTSSGIGRNLAIELVKAGYRVFAGVRDENAAVNWRRRYPARQLMPVRMDITCSDQIESAAAQVAMAMEPGQALYALVNNAGTVLCAPLETCPLDRIRREFEVNLIGPLAVTQAFIPLLRKASGRILFTGSASGRFSPPFLGAYAGTKHGLEAMADALRRELMGSGIRVVVVEPGAIDTAVWDKSLGDVSGKGGERLFGAADGYYGLARPVMQCLADGLRKRAMDAETVARVMVRIIDLERPRARYLVGVDARVQAGLERWLPVRWCDRLVKKVLDLAGFRVSRS